MAEEVPQAQPAPDEMHSSGEESGEESQPSGNESQSPTGDTKNETEPSQKKEKERWIPALPHLPTEILTQLPGHGLSYKELYGLVCCNKRFSEIYHPYLKKEAFADRDGKTALIYAIEKDNEKHVEYLLDNSHDEEPPVPWDAFTAAFYHGNLYIIEMMVSYIFQVFEDDTYDFADQVSSGLSCLVHYVGVYNVAIIEMLLDLGADPNGSNPLQYTTPGSRILEPIPAGELLFEIKDPDVFSFLVRMGAKVDQIRGGETLLENAIDDPEYHQVVPEILEAMVESGAAENMDLGRPFHLAADGPYPWIAELLVEYGLGDHMHITTGRNRTLMHVLAESYPEKQRKATVFMSILMENGMEIDALGGGACPTALLIAASCENWHIVKFLIIAGAWVKEKTTRLGKNVFHYVLEAETPDLDLVEYMLTDGKVGKVGYKHTDLKGVTAFEVLFRRAHRNFLLRRRIGANLKRVFFAVMKYLTDRKDRGCRTGCAYRWLWRHAKRVRRYRPYSGVR